MTIKVIAFSFAAVLALVQCLCLTVLNVGQHGSIGAFVVYLINFPLFALIGGDRSPLLESWHLELWHFAVTSSVLYPAVLYGVLLVLKKKRQH